MSTRATGITVSAIIGVMALLGGLAIVRNWREAGSRFYKLTIRLPLPGRDYYRDRGERTFRVMIGGGYAVAGVVFLAVAVIALASR